MLTTLGFVPQVVKMWRTRSVGDLSAMTFVQLIIGTVLWGVYGIHKRDAIIMAANGVTLVILAVALGLYMRLRGRV